jgi:hypothetical protein
VCQMPTHSEHFRPRTSGVVVSRTRVRCTLMFSPFLYWSLRSPHLLVSFAFRRQLRLKFPNFQVFRANSKSLRVIPMT